MKEIWKDIDGYEGYYQISTYGRLRSLNRYVNNSNGDKRLVVGKIRKPYVNGKYKTLLLSKENKKKLGIIHILVAKAFIPNNFNKPEVNHIDGNPKNNYVDNLEWVTRKENITHAWNIGLYKSEKLSLNLKGYRYSKKRKVRQIDIETNETIKIWETIISASKKLKIFPSSITFSCQGKYKHAGGYKWEYVEEINK